MATNIIYADFDVNLKKNALTGDVIKKTNLEDIRQSIGLLLRTNFYERKWHPEIGSYLPKLLFNQDDDYIKNILKQQILNIIGNYEKRVTINDIWIGYDKEEDQFHGKVTIKITYTINILNTKDTYIYTVTRLK